MQWAVANGIVNGSNGKLNPQNNATRAEVDRNPHALLRDEHVKNKFFGIKIAGPLNYESPGCCVMWILRTEKSGSTDGRKYLA